MKSHILWLFCLLLLMQRANAQSQRLVLMEEFTGENCPPCGTYNPAFNALLDSHAGKIVSIKYQVDIPFGSPPLFSYNKPEVNAASTMLILLTVVLMVVMMVLQSRAAKTKG